MQFVDESTSLSALKAIVSSRKFIAGLQTVLILLGLAMAGYGLVILSSLSIPASEAIVSDPESVSAVGSTINEVASSDSITLEVAGAVEQPGLVVLSQGSRVGDAITAAGGFQAQVDRRVVNQKLNLAELVSDAQKIYVPFAGETENLVPTSPTETELAVPALDLSAADKISINTAGESELDELDGIGQARATAIIQNRPYANLDELLTKKVLSQALFDSLVEQLTL